MAGADEEIWGCTGTVKEVCLVTKEEFHFSSVHQCYQMTEEMGACISMDKAFMK